VTAAAVVAFKCSGECVGTHPNGVASERCDFTAATLGEAMDHFEATSHAVDELPLTADVFAAVVDGSTMCSQSGARGGRWVTWNPSSGVVRCALCNFEISLSHTRPEGDGWGPVAIHCRTCGSRIGSSERPTMIREVLEHQCGLSS
jgi:DNA-directed RNA polymerase subunit RPC12/RpoP